ncbi:MAG TPA: PAS domain S-box protein [Terriglobales bacterium]|nr:PAS domain S-box protein [Terriglobales bacterium]
MNENADPRWLARLRAFATTSSVFVIAMGLLGLAGWVFGVTRLKMMLPGLVTMKANTAVGLIVSGVALWLSRTPVRKSKVQTAVARVFALLVAVVGALSFAEYLSGWDFGIDQLLFAENAIEAAVAGRPGLMSPVTAIGLALLGAALFCLDWRPRGVWPAQVASLLAMMVCLLAVLDFVLGTRATHTRIALHTAVALLLLSIAVPCARPQWGMGRLLASTSMGGMLARRLLPLSVVIPIIIGWFRWYAEIRGLYSDWGGVAVTILSMVALLVGVSGWTAYVIDRTDTEREQNAQQLRRASLYARNLIEASLDPLVTISKDGKIMDVNEATEAATGLRRDRLIGSDFSDYFTEPAKARAGYEQVFAAGAVHDYPLSLRHDSGRVMDVLYNATVYKNQAGEVEGVFAAARDITQQKQAEKKLREQAALLDLAHDAIIVRDLAGRILFWNMGAQDLYGWPAEVALGKAIHELLQTQFPEPLQVLQAGLDQRRQWDGELKHTCRDGKPIVVASRWSLLRDDKGDATAIMEINRDISERKQVEHALQYSEQRYRSLVVATSQVVWTTNVNGEVSGDMPMWREFTGQSFDEIQGWGWINSVHPEDRERTSTVWIRAVKNRTLYDTDYRMRRRDGEYRYMVVRGVPILEQDGSIREWIGTCTDITERRKAEQEIRTLNEELEQRVIQRTAQLEASNKELEAFTYSVSHDLRAPLRHVAGFAKMLVEEYQATLDENAKHYLERVTEGVQRMGQLVDDLLNLARVGRKELGLQVTGLNSIVQEVIAELQPESKGRQVEWKIANLPFVECDPALMRQVFHNLLSNALKFTRPRAQTVIEVGQRQENGQAVTFVRDNGVGFSMKYADKLFGVFQRLHRAEDFEGTGVGLATVQRIIGKHGGRIWAEAELDKGATFYFTLGPSEAEAEKAKIAVAGAQS